MHASALKQLAADAESAESAGNPASALAAWQRALELLPTGAGQRERILAKVTALSSPATGARPEAPPSSAAAHGPAPTGWRKWAAGLGAFGVVLAKLKWVLLLVLGKAKLLLMGLTQAKTFLSMGLFLGVYATQYGWQFALGLVVSIYIHEMGHVAALQQYGIAASAPMFIPGVGAFVRLKQHPATPGQDARVGLAGPIWGAGAAIVSLVCGVALGQRTLLAIADAGAFINLFNLLPVWQLDGGRGFVALSRPQRAVAAATLFALALLVGNGLLWVLAIAAALRAAMGRGAPSKGDPAVLATYLALAVGLTLLMLRAKVS